MLSKSEPSEESNNESDTHWNSPSGGECDLPRPSQVRDSQHECRLGRHARRTQAISDLNMKRAGKSKEFEQKQNDILALQACGNLPGWPFGETKPASPPNKF